MHLLRLALPLALLTGGLVFAAPVGSAGHHGPGAKQVDSKSGSKNTEEEQRMSKKEARMKQRDQEMDKRMKQQKAR